MKRKTRVTDFVFDVDYGALELLVAEQLANRHRARVMQDIETFFAHGRVGESILVECRESVLFGQTVERIW